MTVRLDPHGNEPEALTSLGVTFDGSRALEIGCGDGRLTRIYAHRARAVVAIDPDRQAIDEARDGAWPGHVEFVVAGIDGVPATRAPFDIVLFAWSL